MIMMHLDRRLIIYNCIRCIPYTLGVNTIIIFIVYNVNIMYILVYIIEYN